jgi:putative ABC transport system permease protein
VRNLFGVTQDALLGGIFGALLVVVLVLVGASIRNPLLPRLAWRNVPRRPGFAALITLGLTLGTLILSSAFTTGDTMSQSVRTVVAGALGSADEVVFVPAASQPTGFDLAQSIASGLLLTGVSSPFPASDVQRVRDILANDPRVADVVPILLAQTPVSSGDAGEFRAQLNLLGAPSATLTRLNDGAVLSLADLQPDEVFLNSEAAASLGVTSGDWVRLVPPNADEVRLRVRQVTRLGDLGGGQATVFLPLERLQAMLGLAGQVNQVLVLNRGNPAERLSSSWPVTVELRSAFLDDGSARRLFRAFNAPPAREVLARVSADPAAPRLAEKVRRLLADLDAPEPSVEFKALAQDPEVLSRLASRLPRVVNRGNTPFAAGVAGLSTFRVIDVQSVAQDQADRWGSAFTDLFVVLGSFSLFSGVLLIVLVFSLVALERRGELGITRALGARRREVVLLLAIEGGLYSLISSLFGLGGGVVVGLGIIALAQGLVEEYGFHLEPVIEPTSIAASYGLGVILTFLAVTVTAWRSSRFSIVTAIRDLPDPAPALPGWRALLVSLFPAILGVALVDLGLGRRLSLAYAVGVALAIVGIALTLRWLLRRVRGGGEWLVFTLAGLALISFWALPTDWLARAGLPVFPSAVEMSFLGGIAMLLGAVWVIAYNVGLLRVLRRASTPLWRLSTAYVSSNRFRTGMTLAMFGLVVLSLTLAAVLLTATRAAYSDPEALTGGWDIRARSTQPPQDLRAALAASGTVSPDVFTAIGAAAPYRVEALQLGVPQSRWQSADLLAVDAGFSLTATTTLTGSTADAHTTWRTLTARPGTAVVGAGLLAGSGVRISASEGAGFQPFVLWLRDTRSTQPAVRVEVIGLVDARGPFGNSILVGAPTLAGWPGSDRSTYYLTVPPGSNARELATGLNLALPDLGLTAATIGEELRLVQGVRGLLNWILQGFMGVGLLAGVAAVGTLSTRAVVERRRQIGILRALGFTSRAIGVGLLIESALLSLLGSALGILVGLVVARDTIVFLTRQNAELRFSVPWDQLAGIALLALAAALLMTLLPARQAARLTPAEALRET